MTPSQPDEKTKLQHRPQPPHNVSHTVCKNVWAAHDLIDLDDDVAPTPPAAASHAFEPLPVPRRRCSSNSDTSDDVACL